MDIFDVLTMIGGLCLFLFGMNIMSQSLERSAGSKLELTLSKLTTNKAAGFFTGLGVTAVIQSSSATTVMVVGFVNSGLMLLSQAINVIMGANIGTTVTSWILSLGGISGDSLFVKLLKPTSFSPVLALIGISFYMFGKTNKKKDIGTILLGFATLMFGMDTMSKAVSGLADVPAFKELFIMFENPILGLLVGAILTAIIQSSSASVGILQAFALTGAISYGAAVPIIMGQNIGTCVTAILASIGTNKNAKRASVVHLAFNLIGSIIWLIIFWLSDIIFSPEIFNDSATSVGIAVVHTLFNVGCTIILLPAVKLLEKLAYKIIPDEKKPEVISELDELLLATPAVAIDRSYSLTLKMADLAKESLILSIECLKEYDEQKANRIREIEDLTDHYEDIIGSYLVKLSSHNLSEREGRKSSNILHAIGDFERISDHAVNILESSEELKNKGIKFTDPALEELKLLCEATIEIVELSHNAFINNDLETANNVEPLEQVIDKLKELLRSQHIERLRRGNCSIEAGFVWSDLITNMERVSDHCSNIAGGVIDLFQRNFNIHESLKLIRDESDSYREKYEYYINKYFK